MASIYLDVLDFFICKSLRFGSRGEPPHVVDQVTIWKSQMPADGSALDVDKAKRTRIRLARGCYPDDRDVLLYLTYLNVALGRIAVAGDRHCAAWIFRDLSLLAYREERRLHSYAHSPRFQVLLMPLKKTMPGDEGADLATLLSSSGDPLHDRRPGPTAPAKLGDLMRAIVRTSDDPRLREGAALIVDCRVDDPREPQPSRAFLQHRDSVESRPSDRDARLIGAVLDRLDPIGHSWMPCGPWHNRRSCQTARPRRLRIKLPHGGIGEAERRAARLSLQEWIDETGGDRSLKLAV